MLLLVVGGALTGVGTGAHAVDPSPTPSAQDNTTAHVTVNPIITIDVDPPDFYLDGAPGATDIDSIDVTVATNNATGFTVNLDAPASLVHTNGTDTIAIGELRLDPGSGTFTALQVGPQPAPVGTSITPTPVGGTSATHRYQMTIPAVASGEYTGVLTYTATANVP
jgi:hypothetical protein